MILQGWNELWNFGLSRCYVNCFSEEGILGHHHLERKIFLIVMQARLRVEIRWTNRYSTAIKMTDRGGHLSKNSCRLIANDLLTPEFGSHWTRTSLDQPGPKRCGPARSNNLRVLNGFVWGLYCRQGDEARSGDLLTPLPSASNVV